MRWACLVPVVVACTGCGSDDEQRREDCDALAEQIAAVAENDPELASYQGVDRRANACAEPVPVTQTTSYAPACEELRACLDDLE